MSIVLKVKGGIMSKVEILTDLFRASVSAVQPQKLIDQSIKVDGRHLTVRDGTFEIAKPALVVGFGKAVFEMAAAVEKALGSHLQRGIVSIPHGYINTENVNIFDLKTSKIEFLEGAEHNLPDENSLNAALKIKEFVHNLDEQDTVIVLISGGGSALLPLPKDGITLSEKLDLVKKLGNKGANISEMNCVRKELSQLKGGGLASYCYPARVISLILSDVLGDPLDIIASGPTCLNTDGPEKAINVLKKYNLYNTVPVSIKETLDSALKQKGIEGKEYFRNVNNFVIGNNKIAAEEVMKKTRELGLQSTIISTNVNGDVEEVSKTYLKIAASFSSFLSQEKTRDELVKELTSMKSNAVPINENVLTEDVETLVPKRDICVILAGEPTVTVQGDGIGGRNQQLALSFSMKLENLDCSNEIWFLSCGTDGIDGPTDAAGAIGFSTLKSECVKENLEPEGYLDNNDCYSFYSQLSGGKYLVKTGHTGTNVMDIHLMLILKN